MYPRRAALTFTCAFANIVLLTSPALACSIIATPDQFQLQGTQVPSNIGGALYRNCSHRISSNGEIELTLRAQGIDDELPLRTEHLRDDLYEVIFEEALEDNQTYIVESTGCETAPQSWSFETRGPAPEPEALGVWVPSELKQGELLMPESASCDMMLGAAYVEFNFEPGPDAQIWGDALAFETYVDGQIWEPQKSVGIPLPPGTGRLGYGKEQVYTICHERYSAGDLPDAKALDEGIHRVQIRAFLPGTDLFWTSESHSFVLRCESPDDLGDGDDDDDIANDEVELDEDLEGTSDDDRGCAQTPGSPGILWIAVAGSLLVLRHRRR